MSGKNGGIPAEVMSSTKLEDDDVTEEVMEAQPMLGEGEARETPERSGWTPLVILTAAATTLGCSLPLGYNLGVINTPAFIIKEFCNTSISDRYGYDLSPTQLNWLWSVIVSIMLNGGIAGSVNGVWIADRFGRKGAVAINNLLGLVAAILFISSMYARSVVMLLVGRVIVGLSAGLTLSTVPMYLTEIASVNTRGAFGSLTTLGLTIGVLLSQVLGLESILGRESTWNFLLGAYSIPTLLSALALPFLPESPKYLYIVRGREQKAIEELSRLRGLPAEALSEELEQLEASSKAKKREGTFTICQVLKSSSFQLPLILVCLLHAGQQFSGINAMFYYSTIILERAGVSSLHTQYATIGAGAVNVLTSVLAVFVVNRFGRRPLLLTSCLMCAVSMILLSLSIVYFDYSSWMPYLCIAAVVWYLTWFAFGLGPITYFIGSELFVEGPRSAAMSLGSITNWASNFIVGMTFPSLQSLVGGYAFLPYAASCLILGAFISYYLPETRNRSPEQVAELLKCRPRPAPDRYGAGQNGNKDAPAEGFTIQYTDTGSIILNQ